MDSNDEHNKMMAWATVLYSRSEWELERSEMEGNRVFIAEEIVGEWNEKKWRTS